MSKLKKNQKVKTFCENQLAQGIVSATEIKENYEKAFPNLPKKTLQCYTNTLSRMGANKSKRNEIVKAEQKRSAERDIEEYEEVRGYVSSAKMSSTQKHQVDRQLKSLRKLWELMGRTDPKGWTQEELFAKIETINPMITDARGRYRFSQPAAVQNLLSPFNTMFPNRLRKNWSANLHVHGAGELKDFLTFAEFDSFLAAITDTEQLSVEDWQTLYSCQVNLQCREGHNLTTGILSLTWDAIDWESKTCWLHEKGSHGKAGRVWTNLPLNMFPWLHGYEKLKAMWQRKGRPLG